jgi:hypothetical protein
MKTASLVLGVTSVVVMGAGSASAQTLQDPMAAGAAASQGSIQQTVQQAASSTLGSGTVGGGLNVQRTIEDTVNRNLGLGGLLGSGSQATNPAGIAGTAPFNPDVQQAGGWGGLPGGIGQVGGIFGGGNGGIGQTLSRILGGGFLGDISNFLGNLPKGVEGWLSSILGDLGITDIQAANEQVDSSPSTRATSSGAALAEVLELNIPGRGSFGVRRDLASKAERDTAIGVAQTSALNGNAQQQLKTRSEQSQKVADQAVELGEDSKQRDVSQQILQNMSGQTALSVQIGNETLKEAYQARIDRSLGNLLNAQQAQRLEEANTAARRQGLAAGNVAIQQTGLMSLPGGYYLGKGGNK